ncbi:MAG: hypothetical protein P8181_02300, partial [bacterium]
MTYQIRSRLVRLCLMALLTAAIVCIAASSASAQDEKPADLKKLEKQYKEAIEKGDLEGAVQIAQEIYWEKLPPVLDAIYDVTSLYCQMGDTVQTYQWLEHMLETGFWDYGR